MKRLSSYVGFYDAGDTNAPTYAPPEGSPCICCGKAIVKGSMNVPFHREGDIRRYFFRAHKACWNIHLSDADRAEVIQSLQQPAFDLSDIAVHH